jgi:hypothetical protein
VVLDFQNAAPTQAQEDAVRAAIGPITLYRWGDFDHTVRITWVDDPTLIIGNAHNHVFAYTTVALGGSPIDIRLRRSLGAGPDAEGGFWRQRGINNTLAFLTETTIHELGHVLVAFIPNWDEFPALFFRNGVRGTLGDWSRSADDWEDHIQEAVVEVFKDAFYPGRVYDNRTHWKLPRDNFAAFVRKFPQPGQDITPFPVWHITFEGTGIID